MSGSHHSRRSKGWGVSVRLVHAKKKGGVKETIRILEISKEKEEKTFFPFKNLNEGGKKELKIN